MRFRLRYRNQALDLLEGEFAIGRNASCQLVLDDPLVSRRHAILTISHASVELEDLRSRNGVQVNGHTIVGPVVLTESDVFTIGSEALSIAVVEPTATFQLSTLSRKPHSEFPAPAIRTPSSEMDHLEASMMRRTNQFRLLGGVAGKALAMGRTAEAERLLASALADVIEASRAGRLLPGDLVDDAAQFSARLAGATGKGGWADYVIELYAAQGRLPSSEVIDELHHVYRKLATVDRARLRAFVAQMRMMSDQFGPREHFVMQRLEGLERLALLRS
jgi:FHA domain